jgi:hypothetical protein
MGHFYGLETITYVREDTDSETYVHSDDGITQTEDWLDTDASRFIVVSDEVDPAGDSNRCHKHTLYSKVIPEHFHISGTSQVNVPYPFMPKR